MNVGGRTGGKAIRKGRGTVRGPKGRGGEQDAVETQTGVGMAAWRSCGRNNRRTESWCGWSTVHPPECGGPGSRGQSVGQASCDGRRASAPSQNPALTRTWGPVRARSGLEARGNPRNPAVPRALDPALDAQGGLPTPVPRGEPMLSHRVTPSPEPSVGRPSVTAHL